MPAQGEINLHLVWWNQKKYEKNAGPTLMNAVHYLLAILSNFWYVLQPTGTGEKSRKMLNKQENISLMAP